MINELLLIGSVIFIFSMVLIAYKLFGKAGLYCASALATVLANIEVLILINAFGTLCLFFGGDGGIRTHVPQGAS